MTFLWAFLIVIGVIILTMLLLATAALASPIVLAIDSTKGQARLRWFGWMEYRRPLPGSEGEAGLWVAGKSTRIGGRKAKRKAKRQRGEVRKPKRNRARAARFLRRCVREPAIRRVLASRFGQLGQALSRSISVAWPRVSVSLPDPAWNGMLAGAMAWMGGGQASPVHVNFTGENEIWLEVRLYPYRVVKALLGFSIGLPYRALWREWRASSAIVPG